MMSKHLQYMHLYIHTHTVRFDPRANPVMHNWNSYPHLTNSGGNREHS